MAGNGYNISPDRLPRFDRDFFKSDNIVSVIGYGAIGGKASGLAFIQNALVNQFRHNTFENIEISIPRLAVIATNNFDNFMKRNNLYDMAASHEPDQYIAHAFNKAELPAEMVGDLRALIASVNTPLAIRSSSLLEDAMYEPFAGVYATKMIPNNQPDIDSRFRKLVEAIKFVYASTYFRAARDYHRSVGRSTMDEKMAVIIQEVVGRRHYDRFYPDIAGVARSYNFYSVGKTKPEDGVVDLALGLGKSIVDGGLVWSYSPAFPNLIPPVNSPRDLLKLTQTEFWAVNMGRSPAYDPIKETEFLVKGSLADAEYDGTLKYIASTYRSQDDRLVPGVGVDGPRALTFAPILSLEQYPLNNLIKVLMNTCEKAVGCEVEIEFALTFDSGNDYTARLGFLQVRPMVVSHSKIEITSDEMNSENVLAASDRVLGNGIVDSIRDIIYIMPELFNAKHTRQIAGQLSDFNSRMLDMNKPYLLIGFGRWGSSDPWLGTPVEWGNISGVKAIVEATLPDMDVELSQGSHFFHNLTSLQICYFSVHHAGPYRINWEWLKSQKEVSRTEFIRHISLDKELTVKVDGRSGRGVILT
jgi:hypothetical protein